MTSLNSTVGSLLSAGVGADPGMLRREGIIVRGARASKTSNLGTLRNVGGMLTEERIFYHTPYSAKALELLSEDPLDKEILENLPADKVTSERDSVSWSKHLLALEAARVLKYSKGIPEYARSISARYTSVWKDVGDTEEKSVARAVFDLRRLNLVSTKKGVDFELLAACNMVPLLIGLNTSRVEYVIVHADVSNMYYQLPVGKALGRRCLFRFSGRYMEAEVLPMGFKKSCGIAQGISMGLILKEEEGDVNLGVPEEAKDRTSAPGFVLLKNGGLIILVYDSILIICPKDHSRQWQKRLRRNFEERANLLFKYCEIALEDVIVPYCGLELRKTRNGLQWRVGDQSIATWKVLRSVALRPAPRTLFRIVGFIRFAASIQGIARYKLGRVSKMQSRLGLVVNWDEESLSEEEIEKAWETFDFIVREREESKNCGWRHRKSHLPRTKGDGKEYCVVAVDATPFRWAVNLSANGGSFDVRKSGPFKRRMEIGQAESRSSREGISLAVVGEFSVIVLCNDHRAVGRAYWKGYSTADELDSDIERSMPSLWSRVIVFVDVPSQENFADIDSRPDDVYSETEILQRHYDTLRRAGEALRRWRETAVDYFSRESLDLEDAVQEVDDYDSDLD